MSESRKRNYLSNERLIEEIKASQAIFKERKRKSNSGRVNASECLTRPLIDMMMLLVDKVAQNPRWRKYCVDESTECLTQRGWLGIDQITTDDLILSASDGRLRWSKIKSIYRGESDGWMFHLTSQGLDAMVTSDHKFLTSRGLEKVDLLRERDQLVLMQGSVSNVTPSHDDAFVELVGWTITEGSYYDDPNRSYTRVSIAQNEGRKADRIRNCLNRLDEGYGETLRESTNGNTLVVFSPRKELGLRLIEAAPDKVPTMEFILSLDQRQRELLIDTMIAGDGHRTDGLNYTQCCPRHTDSFITLCTLSGLRTTTRVRGPVGYGKQPVHHVRVLSPRNNHAVVANIDFHGGKGARTTVGDSKKSYPNVPSVRYTGRVWCPETEYGVFVARRNGTVYLTGNSYIEDMKGDARMGLIQHGLKFDINKSQNAFSYYTQIVWHTFLTFTEKERKQRKIKDRIIETTPDIQFETSFGHQAENEINQLDRDLDGTQRVKADPVRMRRAIAQRRKYVPKESILTIDSEPVEHPSLDDE